MYLNVILTIFVLVQVVTMVLIYKWWDKYGRDLVKSFLDLKKTPMGQSNMSNPFGQIPDMGEMMKQLNQMTKMMGKK
jgi:hypothetical protein